MQYKTLISGILTCSLGLFLAMGTISCTSPPTSIEIEHALLDSAKLFADHSMDSILSEIIQSVNSLAVQNHGKTISLARNFNYEDTTQLLLVPFAPRLGKYAKVPAYSDLNNRVIFVQPGYIKEYASNKVLNDSTGFKDLLALMLLHELGHFVIRAAGEFDKMDQSGDSLHLTGEVDMGLSPVVMTTWKKNELKADSVAVSMIMQSNNSKNVEALTTSMNLQMLLGGMEFMLSGLRMVRDFGSPNIGLLKDEENTHPNLELRLAFMNYYMHPTEEKREQIDNYLYEREVKPVERQLTDPRIYQGDKKP